MGLEEEVVHRVGVLLVDLCVNSVFDVHLHADEVVQKVCQKVFLGHSEALVTMQADLNVDSV